MDRLIDDSRSDVAPSGRPARCSGINPPRWVARMFGGGAARRPATLLSSATSGVEEAAAVAARGIAAGTSSSGESVFSVADFSDAEAYRPGHPHRANAPPPAAADGTGRVALHAGRAVATSAAHEARSRRRRRTSSRGLRGGGGGAVAGAAGAGGGSRRGRRSAPRWPARGGRLPRIDRRGSSSRRRGSCDVLSGAVVTLKTHGNSSRS